MKNPITTLHIQNFKTIKDVKVKCKRINIIIGKPNVGKSNFLEALSLFGAICYTTSTEKLFADYIRYKKIEDLFYDKRTEETIFVDTNIGVICMKYFLQPNNFCLAMAPSKNELKNYKLEYGSLSSVQKLFAEKEEDFNRASPFSPYYLQRSIKQSGDIADFNYINWSSPVKRYDFKKDKAYNTTRATKFLSVPNGTNLYTIVNSSNSLKKEISNFFKEYKLEFVLRPSNTTFELQKKVKGFVYSNDYEMIADTMQRMIFNIAAIESNKESILLFEEPEAHSFPPFVKMFAEKVTESKANQFFITTHSPFILNTIIENTPLEEVAVFIAGYDKFQTKLTELTLNELQEMLDYGNDIFFSPKVLN